MSSNYALERTVIRRWFSAGVRICFACARGRTVMRQCPAAQRERYALGTSTLAAVALLLAAPSGAVTPPPDATFEEKVCAATHVFHGIGTNFRVVRKPNCQLKNADGFLSLCEEVEVTVTVEEVLKPREWVPTGPVVFRFGGGWFSISSLERDLANVPRIFYTVAQTDGSETVYRTSYPWFLGTGVDAKPKVLQVLGACGDERITTRWSGP